MKLLQQIFLKESPINLYVTNSTVLCSNISSDKKLNIQGDIISTNNRDSLNEPNSPPVLENCTEATNS